MSFEFRPEHLDDDYFMTDQPIGYIPFDTQIHPFAYLQFAREDIEDGHEARNHINAIGNAKRALHLQVETIANGYGFKQLKKRNNFPTKLSFLTDLGITTPEIINRLNALRNEIEHDYVVPSVEKTKDFVDVVELFLHATALARTCFPDDVYFESSEAYQWEEQGLSIVGRARTRPDDLTIQVEMFKGKVVLPSQTVEISEGNYFVWLRKLIACIYRR